MKFIYAAIISAVLLGPNVWATEIDSTGNLVYTTTNPAPTGTNIGQSWTGFTNVTSTGGNTTGDNGAVTGYNPSTGTFMFGYNQGTIAYTYAINQALANAGTGIQVRGYTWSWDINNNNYDNRQGSTDTLTARIITYGANNTTIRQQDSWTYNTKFDWTTFSGTVNYATAGPVSEFGNMRIEFTGRDAGFWAGYYGPMVRNIDVRLRYSVDPCAADPQSSPTCNGFRTYYNMWDDGYAQVDLPFVFPYYGFTFNRAYMFTNGVIGFLDPNNVPGGFCCDGINLHDQRFSQGSPWNFSIYALNTDLYPGPNSQFYTERLNNGNGIRFYWDRVNEIGTNNENTFSVELRNTGYIGINYQQVNLSPWRNPLIGITGDIYQGQYSQYYFGQASSMPTLAGTTLAYTGTETTDICAIDPLHSPQCPGYQQAYFDQQCSMDPLYNSQCPGYDQAYYTQQCSVSALYDSGCPGYQQAYFDQQCSINALYNTSCPGYQQAYFNQQCSNNALYSESCPGYAQAYFNQQCSLNPLYNESCPGYAQAYFDQQCQLNALYNSQCPGYATAFILQNPPSAAVETKTVVVEQPTTTSSQIVADPTRNEATVVVDAGGVELSTTGEISAPTGQTETAKESAKEAAKESEKQEAKKEEEKKQPNTRAVALARSAAAATVRLAEARAQEAVEISQLDQSVSEAAGLGTGITLQGFRPIGIVQDAKEENENRERPVLQNNMILRTDGDNRTREVAGSQPPTGPSVRRGGAVEGMEGGADMTSLAAAPADFNTYLNSQLKDSQFYTSREIYRGQRNVDNAAALRGLGSDKLHQRMVDQQYNIGQ